MNNAQILGHLAKNPELRYTPNGTAVATFTLAVNRPKRDGQEQQPDWINCVAWSKIAENCANYLKKGSKALIEGRIQTRSFDDKNGVKRYVTEIVAHTVHFLSKPSEESKPAKPSNNQDYGDPFSNNQPINISDDLPF